MSDSPSNKISPDSSAKASPETFLRSISLPANFDSLDEVREFVGQSAEDSGMVSSDIYAVQLAVDEAFTNIVEHAYGGECLEEVDCICQNTENALIITLKDCGEPFNPLDVPSPDLESDLEKRKIGGLGLYFMRQLMDEIQFTFLPESESDEGCNILRMVKLKEKKSGGSRAP